VKKKNSPIVAFVEETATQLLNLLGVDGTVNVLDTSSSEEDGVEVTIDTEKETGLLIGAHGATLNSIQIFLGMAVKQHLGRWVRVVVNIGDWKEKQEDRLVELARTTAQRAKQTGETQRLYNLTPSQRRIIHMKLSEDNEIVTESAGEGEERYLMVSVKESPKK
jgi:spoIIIJ-associated protein